ncbi:MAG: TetR/AcrR family transcriptional regulator [Rhodopseudomonas palustris]|nr:TetR/AcrR family transcriptional regulator [Rhodopseudomonas palustris]
MDQVSAAGLAVFDRDGLEGGTVAAIRQRAGPSNGSFFHLFKSKQELAGALFVDVLRRYHAAIVAPFDGAAIGAAAGIERLIRAHLDWVMLHRLEARFLFEIARNDWGGEVRAAQRAENDKLAERLDGWRQPLAAARRIGGDARRAVFRPADSGPAQMLCPRGWLSGRDRSDPCASTPIN